MLLGYMSCLELYGGGEQASPLAQPAPGKQLPAAVEWEDHSQCKSNNFESKSGNGVSFLSPQFFRMIVRFYRVLSKQTSSNLCSHILVSRSTLKSNFNAQPLH